MPIDLEIDDDRRLLTATARSAPPLPELTGYFGRLVSDATLPYRKIFDERAAELEAADPAAARHSECP